MKRWLETSCAKLRPMGRAAITTWLTLLLSLAPGCGPRAEDFLPEGMTIKTQTPTVPVESVPPDPRIVVVSEGGDPLQEERTALKEHIGNDAYRHLLIKEGKTCYALIQPYIGLEGKMPIGFWILKPGREWVQVRPYEELPRQDLDDPGKVPDAWFKEAGFGPSVRKKLKAEPEWIVM